MVINKIITRLIRYIRDVFINLVAASVLVPKYIRFVIYKLYGIKTASSNICPRCFFGSSDVIIGSGTFINYQVVFDSSSKITIGNNCAIAMGVLFCTSTHKLGDTSRRALEVIGHPITVGDGCWIGANAVILPGVTIGNGCIIAAGSVVTKDCEPNSVYAGVPAKMIKILD